MAFLELLQIKIVISLPMSKSNPFLKNSAAWRPLTDQAPVYSFRDNVRFDVCLTDSPNIVGIYTDCRALYDHLCANYDVTSVVGVRRRGVHFYGVYLRLEAFIHFVAWNRSVFRYAGGAETCCSFFL
ncbi:hypothetical protein [Microvirus mar36]|uniref:Uncharacterized protein n=1 Tax=Microvirus mar36 TaxID=2851170 RepID=A0A8F5MJ83_9VIRU|nr:hypothetical protein [Microvirus mar36]